MPSTPFLILIGCWLVILLLLWIAGTPALTRANDEIEEGD
jgi:hypothetical protein